MAGPAPVPPGRRASGLGLAGAAPRPVERPVPLRQAVYDALTELIITGALQPGEHLVESELAKHLGVSRQPVREALHRLQAEGWVDLRPGQGAFVHVPTEHEVDQLLAVRSLLETESARLAAREAKPEQIARLREFMRDGVEAMQTDDVERLVALNASLHAYVTEVSGNAVLGELISLVDRRMRWYYTPIARHRGAESWDEHGALIDALAAHDEDRASEIMRGHTEKTRKGYHEYMSAGGT
ncbi:MAG: FCD domain-containing protein [Streptosporangiales bacterium]|nr:FCD domain-containing protein [Streptosporangiales bacterium]